MKTIEEALDTILDSYGADLDVLAMHATFDSTCPAVCMNDNCYYTTDKEPDSTNGWCDVCETNSMKSLLILMGII